MKFAMRIVLWLGAIALTIFGVLLIGGARLIRPGATLPVAAYRRLTGCLSHSSAEPGSLAFAHAILAWVPCHWRPFFGASVCPYAAIL